MLYYELRVLCSICSHYAVRYIEIDDGYEISIGCLRCKSESLPFMADASISSRMLRGNTLTVEITKARLTSDSSKHKTATTGRRVMEKAAR
jgi:hypothetical protein